MSEQKQKKEINVSLGLKILFGLYIVLMCLTILSLYVTYINNRSISINFDLVKELDEENKALKSQIADLILDMEASEIENNYKIFPIASYVFNCPIGDLSYRYATNESQGMWLCYEEELYHYE